MSLQTLMISVSQPGYQNWATGLKRGPVILEVVTMFNNWQIAVDQGEF